MTCEVISLPQPEHTMAKQPQQEQKAEYSAFRYQFSPALASACSAGLLPTPEIIMFQAPGSPQHRAAMLVRTRREVQTLSDTDLIDRQCIVKAVREALTAGATDSDAANTVLADAIAKNTDELVGLLDEVVHRTYLPGPTAPLFPPSRSLFYGLGTGVSSRQGRVH